MKIEKMDAVLEALKKHLPQPSFDALKFVVWADKEDEAIYIAPPKDSFCRDFFYVKEVALFAAYHDLDLTTYQFESGAGLRLS